MPVFVFTPPPHHTHSLPHTPPPTPTPPPPTHTHTFTEELEANINDHKRSAELLELQETLYWPSVSQLHPEAFISDSLREQLTRQPCCELLASKDRLLVDKGCLRLLDSKGRPSTELQVYLFTDILLLTEEHRPTRKEVSTSTKLKLKCFSDLEWL